MGRHHLRADPRAYRHAIGDWGDIIRWCYGRTRDFWEQCQLLRALHRVERGSWPSPQQRKLIEDVRRRFA